MTQKIPDWCIFRGDATDRNQQTLNYERLRHLPDPPPWRDFSGDLEKERGSRFKAEPDEIEKINAALYLRRPLLITGKPGTGKTSLIYAVAQELGLGSVLRWSITSRTTLKDGLYQYDAIGRLQASQDKKKENAENSEETGNNEKTDKADDGHDIDPYISLGPLGSAFFANEYKTPEGETKYYPRILLIDEIDKSDIDLPNDLLHVFEEGFFEIPELVRLKDIHPTARIRSWGRDSAIVKVEQGEVKCKAFPLVVMTSNGEREFPPAFLRRCLQLRMDPPDKDKLKDIVDAHLTMTKQNQPGKEKDAKQREQNEAELREQMADLLNEFFKRREGHTDKGKQDLATDQLLNAIYLAINDVDPREGIGPKDKNSLLDALWRPLSGD